MHVKFQRTNGVGNSFNRVTLAMCKIIHGIDAPGISCSMMRHVSNAIHQGVPHVHVGMSHIYFGPQNFGPIRMNTITHLFK